MRPGSLQQFIFLFALSLGALLPSGSVLNAASKRGICETAMRVVNRNPASAKLVDFLREFKTVQYIAAIPDLRKIDLGGLKGRTSKVVNTEQTDGRRKEESIADISMWLKDYQNFTERDQRALTAIINQSRILQELRNHLSSVHFPLIIRSRVPVPLLESDNVDIGDRKAGVGRTIYVKSKRDLDSKIKKDEGVLRHLLRLRSREQFAQAIRMFRLNYFRQKLTASNILAIQTDDPGLKLFQDVERAFTVERYSNQIPPHKFRERVRTSAHTAEVTEDFAIRQTARLVAWPFEKAWVGLAQLFNFFDGLNRPFKVGAIVAAVLANFSAVGAIAYVHLSQQVDEIRFDPEELSEIKRFKILREKLLAIKGVNSDVAGMFAKAEGYPFNLHTKESVRMAQEFMAGEMHQMESGSQKTQKIALEAKAILREVLEYEETKQLMYDIVGKPISLDAMFLKLNEVLVEKYPDKSTKLALGYFLGLRENYYFENNSEHFYSKIAGGVFDLLKTVLAGKISPTGEVLFGGAKDHMEDREEIARLLEVLKNRIENVGFDEVLNDLNRVSPQSP